MAERTVSVRLKAEVSGYIAGLKSAQKATTDLAQATLTHADKSKKAYSDIGKIGLVAGGVLAAGVGLAVKAFMDFDKQMSATGAATKANATEMEALRATALKAGKDTKYSATEAAAGEEALGKAGVSVTDIVHGGLSGALNLAAAGNQSVADAADTAATAMVQFGLKGSAVPHIADLLAAGAGKAQGEVSDLALALKYVGPIAGQMGVSLEQTVGTLALFAHNGILADQAGTGLRGVLSALTSPSKIAAKQMSDLGINVFDAKGKFIGLDGVAGQLHDSMSGLTEAERSEALGRIFGNEQLTVARVLYKDGAAGVHDWTGKVDDAGYATDQAARKMDNLAGDLEKLKGSLETALIESGSSANGVLRDLTQTADGLVGEFLNLPGAAQDTALGVAAVGSAVLVTAGGLLVLLPRIQAAKLAMAELGAGGTRVTGALVGLSKAAGTIALVVGGLEVVGATLSRIEYGKPADVDKLTTSLVNLATKSQNSGELARVAGKGFGDFRDAVKTASDPSLRDQFDSMLSVVTKHLGADSKINESKKALDDYGKSLANLVSQGHPEAAAAAFDQLAAEAAKVGVSAGDLRKLMPSYTDALAAADAQSQLTGGSTKALGTATSSAAQAAKAAATAYLKESAGIDAVNKANQTALGAQLAFNQDTLDATQALKDNGKTLSQHTAKGIANNQMLLKMAQDAIGVRDALVAQGVSTQRANGQLGLLRDKLVKTAESFGLSRAAATRYVDKLLQVPQGVATKVTTPGMDPALDKTRALGRRIGDIPRAHATSISTPGGSQAWSMLSNIKQSIFSIPTSRTIRVTTLFDSGGNPALLRAAHGGATGGMWTGHGFQRRGYDAGGLVDGPGTSTSDSIPAPWLSKGEFVVRAAAVDRYGPGLLQSINSMRFASDRMTSRSGGGSSVVFAPVININGAQDPRAVRREVDAALSQVSSIIGRQADRLVRGG